jgi:hypothetical protein
MRSAMREKAPPAEMTEDHIKQEWRKLGFFCELDNEKKAWILTGSRAGLLYFPDLLLGFVADPKNAANAEHEHYGPYGSLEVMTWTEAGLDGHAIRGSLVNLAHLASLVEGKLAIAQPGDRLRIREEYAATSPYALVLDVRADGFDPASTDRERLGSAARLPVPDKPKALEKPKEPDKPSAPKKG